jgi:hypothetical protein
MAYPFLAGAILLFALGMKLFGVVPKAGLAAAAAREATAVMTSKQLSEQQKEAAVKGAAIGMCRHACSILVRATLTLAIPLAFVVLGSAAGLYSTDDAAAAVGDWRFIAGSTIAMVALLLVLR